MAFLSFTTVVPRCDKAFKLQIDCFLLWTVYCLHTDEIVVVIDPKFRKNECVKCDSTNLRFSQLLSLTNLKQFVGLNRSITPCVLNTVFSTLHHV